MQILEVDRTNLATTRVVDVESASLTAGQIRLRIDRFALTANNVTYGKAGDFLGYWDFFPSELPWGRVPAMGWAEVIESANPNIEVGGRYYGWFPMADEVVFSAAASSKGFTDDGEHRAAHAPVYKAFISMDADPFYDDAPDGEDRQALLRGLFGTGFLIDTFFADPTNEAPSYFDAEQAVVLSASSKTAIAYAQQASERGISVVGVTSPGNKSFVESLGFHDRVITYSEVASLELEPSVIVDFAGNAEVVSAVHHHLGDMIRYSMQVGLSHHDAAPLDNSAMPGPAPEFFMAPFAIERIQQKFGAAEYTASLATALSSFVDSSRSWLTVERHVGAIDAAEVWAKLVRGDVPPAIGISVSL